MTQPNPSLNVCADKRIRTAIVLAVLYGIVVGVQVFLFMRIRGSASDFAGGNDSYITVGTVSAAMATGFLAVEVVLALVAAYFGSRRRLLWFLLPLPFVVYASWVLILASSGPGSGG